MGEISYIIRFSPDGKITDANERFFRDTGYSRESLVGKSYSTLFVSEAIEGQNFEEFWAKVLSGEIKHGKFELRRLDGSSFWVLANYFPRRDAAGKVNEVVKFAQDITEIVRLQLENERKARETEALNKELAREHALRLEAETLSPTGDGFLQRALDNAGVGVLAVDSSGKPTYANDAALELLGAGVRPDARLDELSRVYEFYRETDGAPYPAENLPLTRALKGTSSRIADAVVRRDDGDIPVVITAVPTFDEQGAISGAVALVERRFPSSPTNGSPLAGGFEARCLEAIVNASNETFFAIDDRFRVIVANETMRRKYRDAGREIVLGASVWDLLPAEDHDYHRAHFSRALSGESFVVPVRYADGK
ncbi:MAG: PAS domain-containing protein, partial [Bacteroidia bacterium]|nr:PAS domain-containing protein [Bacteroidia bacterium]